MLRYILTVNYKYKDPKSIEDDLAPFITAAKISKQKNVTQVIVTTVQETHVAIYRDGKKS